MDTLRDICLGKSAKRSEARSRLAKEAQPGTTWGADGYKFGVLVVGEVAPRTLRCARFDGEAFTGHADVADVATHLIECFGLGVKRVNPPEWMTATKGE
jgi:hypothetical protein